MRQSIMMKQKNTPTMRLLLPTLLWAALLTTIMGCQEKEEQAPVRSAYYWSTTWEGDSATLGFISDNDISRLYLRYFDVVVTPEGEVMPNATIRFAKPVPDSMEVIPTVFIVNECMQKDVSILDSLLLHRILQMSETHDISQVHEIQIDCDWTKTTQKTYFAMLERLRDAAHKKGLQLSATIRLHQLSMEVPPVDRGVLMMYNTGNVADIRRNPILDMDDAGPYLRRLSNYDLPLATAYPVFAWQLLFRGDQLIGILHGDDDMNIFPGDTIIQREAELSTVLQAKEAVTRRRSNANNEIILFDISPQNIQRIKQYNYEEIFSH